jgi:hypothetical protein
MKNAFVLSFVAAFAVGFFAAPSHEGFVQQAEAGDVYKATLTSSDAGSTNTAAITQQLPYSIECDIEAAYKTGTSTPLTVNTAQDYVLSAGNLSPPSTSVRQVYSRDFEVGGHRYIAARALDGGNPNCRVFQRLKNTQ